MKYVLQEKGPCRGSRARQAASILSVAFLGLGGLSAAHAAQLMCGPGASPVRISTTAASDWSTDAKYVSNPTGPVATVRDDFWWYGYFKPETTNHDTNAGNLSGQPLAGKWLTFGEGDFVNGATNGGSTGTGPYPAVIVNGNTANGAWISGRATFIYNDALNIADNVDLSTIKIVGTGGADNSAVFVVKPSSLPGNVDNTNWIQTTNLAGLTYGSARLINLNGSSDGLGFYYGDNTIGFATSSESTTASLPTGIMADVEITADCLPELPPAPTPTTTALSCPVDKLPGDEFEIGPFTTNARDWKWTWRTSTATPRVLEEVEQPLYDNYKYRSYFNPSQLESPNQTQARWISPGTTNPSNSDLPGVPYPAATGQSKPGYYGSVFTMNQPITVGDNVDLDSIQLKGRFGFDDTGDSVFVQPAGQPMYQPFKHLLPDGYGLFTSYTTASIPGFEVGENTIGLVLDGGQFSNDCAGGVCALGAIADFTIVAKCQEPPPVDPTQQTINFRQPNPNVYSATNGATVSWAPTPPLQSTANLPVTYTSQTGSVCTVNANTGVVTLVSPAVAGTCTIQADAAAGTRTIDNVEYNVLAAPSVVRSMQITLLRDQEITFIEQEGRDVANGPFDLASAATASSGLDVTYTSLTPSICTVSGSTVTPKQAGTCTIAANQPGNAQYIAAEQVTRSILLTGAAPAANPTPVPALGAVGLGLLGALSAGMGAVSLRRRTRVSK